MAKDEARELAQAITEQDADKIFSAIGTHIKALKAAWEQEFVASRKDFLLVMEMEVNLLQCRKQSSYPLVHQKKQPMQILLNIICKTNKEV